MEEKILSVNVDLAKTRVQEKSKEVMDSAKARINETGERISEKVNESRLAIAEHVEEKKQSLREKMEDQKNLALGSIFDKAINITKKQLGKLEELKSRNVR